MKDIFRIWIKLDSINILKFDKLYLKFLNSDYDVFKQYKIEYCLIRIEASLFENENMLKIKIIFPNN